MIVNMAEFRAHERFGDRCHHNLSVAEGEGDRDGERRWLRHYRRQGREILRAQRRFARWWREHGRRDDPPDAA